MHCQLVSKSSHWPKTAIGLQFWSTWFVDGHVGNTVKPWLALSRTWYINVFAICQDLRRQAQCYRTNRQSSIVSHHQENEEDSQSYQTMKNHSQSSLRSTPSALWVVHLHNKARRAKGSLEASHFLRSIPWHYANSAYKTVLKQSWFATALRSSMTTSQSDNCKYSILDRTGEASIRSW